jgi:hypothetical protein
MNSKLANQLREDLMASIRRLTPEERLKAFFMHNRLGSELYQAGRRHCAAAAHGMPP